MFIVPKDPTKVQYPVDLKTLVIRSDPEWPRKSVNPVQYRFSQGKQEREFTQPIRPGQPYDWI